MSSLELPLLHPPIESLSQITRNTQKIIAKEATTCATGVTMLTNAMKVRCNTEGGYACNNDSNAHQQMGAALPAWTIHGQCARAHVVNVYV